MALRKLKAENKKRDLIKRQKEIETELTEISQDLNDIVTRSEKLDESGTDEEKEELLKQDDQLEERKGKLEAENIEIRNQLKEVEKELENFGKGEELTMAEKRENTETLDKRNALNNYLHKKDIQKEGVRAAGLVSEDAEVLIPVDVIYQPRDEVETEYNWAQYINHVSVGTSTGSYPIMLRTNEKMHTVEELNANPRLKNPEFKEVTWKIKTYRGYIPISQELIDDSAVDLNPLIAKHLNRIVNNTINDIVSPLIKDYQPLIVRDLDGLKEVVNKRIDPAYQIRMFMSMSMYHYIDTLKDTHGNYILHDDITSPSGKTLFGYQIIRMPDTMIGAYNGQLCAFIGDSVAAITEFDRNQISAQWDDHNLYDNNIQTGFRDDIQSCDEKAGYYVLFTPVEKDIVLTTSDEQTPETVEGVEATIAIQDNKAVIKYTGLTDQVITYSLKDSKGAIVAEMVGRFTTEKTEDTITVSFYQDMVKGDYTLEAKVLDQKKYKCIKSAKLNIKQRSDEATKILNGTPIVIGS